MVTAGGGCQPRQLEDAEERTISDFAEVLEALEVPGGEAVLRRGEPNDPTVTRNAPPGTWPPA